MLKYPILMVHGMGFRDRKHFGYWGRIPKALEKRGERIFFGGQDSNGTVEHNGEFLAKRVREIIDKSGCGRLNVIAHSKGGLDMRYAVSTLGIGEYIASLSTVSTPHNGSLTVDKLLRLPDPLVRFAGHCSDLWLRLMGDKNPNAYRVFHSFTTSQAKLFNENNPDDEKVYYQSFAFTFSSMFSDMTMFIPHLAVKLVEGENDGLLTPRAAQWTNFRGVYKGAANRGISHCDEVDMRRRRLTRKRGEGISDIVDFYIELVSELEEKGF